MLEEERRRKMRASDCRLALKDSRLHGSDVHGLLDRHHLPCFLLVLLTYLTIHICICRFIYLFSCLLQLSSHRITHPRTGCTLSILFPLNVVLYKFTWQR